MEKDNTIITNQVLTPKNEHNFGWLLIHSWNILFKHNSRNERISRGEFFSSSLTLTLVYLIIVGLIIGIAGPTIGGIFSLLATIGFCFYVLKLTKQRFNDIGIGKKGMYWLLFTMIAVAVCIITITILGASMATNAVENNTSPNFAVIGLVGIIGFIAFIILAWYQIQLQFENGELGENRYGFSPLVRQPNTNKPYIFYGLIFWILYIVVIVIITVVARLGQDGGSQGDINDQINSMIQQEKQMIEDAVQTEDTNPSNDLNISN